jgi:uncharacterized protein (DUF2141 family)
MYPPFFLNITMVWINTTQNAKSHICVAFSNNNIGCDDDEEEEVDSDDMEYTEDAIDNMILEFSGD